MKNRRTGRREMSLNVNFITRFTRHAAKIPSWKKRLKWIIVIAQWSGDSSICRWSWSCSGRSYIVGLGYYNLIEFALLSFVFDMSLSPAVFHCLCRKYVVWGLSLNSDYPLKHKHNIILL